MTPVVARVKKAPEKKSAPKKEEPVENNGSTRGLTWGLNLHGTLRRVMEENFKKHLTDDQIIQFLLAEFPNRENKNILYNVREIRWRYNFGKLHEDKEGNPHAPEKKSVRYNTDGTVYEKKTAKPKLSEAEKAMKIEERREHETERRKTEAEALAKAEEKLAQLREKIETRQAEWETRNGQLVITKKEKTPKKIAVKKSK